jgi:4-amino-4-deoxy-L-arabinose transferase-like glycosyltransferase
MTIDQYTAEIARCQRQLIWRMVIAIAPVFLAFGIAGIVRYNNPDLADFVGPILVFAVGLPMMLCGFVYADRTHKSFPFRVRNPSSSRQATVRTVGVGY